MHKQKQKQVLVLVLSSLFWAVLLPQVVFCASVYDNTPDFGNGSCPAIASDSNGDLSVAWSGRYDNTHNDIYYAQYNGTWSGVKRMTRSMEKYFEVLPEDG